MMEDSTATVTFLGIIVFAFTGAAAEIFAKTLGNYIGAALFVVIIAICLLAVFGKRKNPANGKTL